MKHIPVLLNEVINILKLHEGKFIIDGTLGGGGHAKEIIRMISPRGKFLGIDKDKDVIQETEKMLNQTISEEKLDIDLTVKEGGFEDIERIVEEEKLGKADGLLLDLGFSSFQIESKDGFSFNKETPLMMRYDGDESQLTAEKIVNEFDEETLARIFKDFGQEKYSREIANRIVKARQERPIKTTLDLVNIIKKVVPEDKSVKIHPATKSFMALRIFVNDEFGALKDVLENSPKFMKNDSILAVISFHSLEDKIVRSYFAKLRDKGLAYLINKEPIQPKEKEILNNPKSRSAKLRAIHFIK